MCDQVKKEVFFAIIGPQQQVVNGKVVFTGKDMGDLEEAVFDEYKALMTTWKVRDSGELKVFEGEKKEGKYVKKVSSPFGVWSCGGPKADPHTVRSPSSFSNTRPVRKENQK